MFLNETHLSPTCTCTSRTTITTSLKARIAAEEAAKKEAEEEAARKAAEQAAYDSDKDLIPIKEDPTIEWGAAEEDTTDPAAQVLQEILESRAIEESESESEPEMTERDRDLAWQRERQMMRPPLVISHLKSRAVATGTNAKLTCNVTGPGITVRWMKKGRPIDLKPEKYKFFNSDGLLSLEILNVKKRDEAEYSCIITNKNGETSTLCALQVYDSTGSDRPSPPTFITIKGKKLRFQIVKKKSFKWTRQRKMWTSKKLCVCCANDKQKNI